MTKFSFVAAGLNSRPTDPENSLKSRAGRPPSGSKFGRSSRPPN